MGDEEMREMRVAEKRASEIPAEYTKSGPTFTPTVDIFETDHEIILLADMPGVEAKDLIIDLRDNVLTLQGRC